MNLLDLFILLIGLILGNYIAQYTSEKNWRVALDRSFFQALALLLVAVFSSFN